MDLSPSEYKVADLVARGLTEKEIADKLCVSYKTVHAHTYNIRKKWNAKCAVDIARTFILSLENPKQYFAALAFLIIQFHIVVDLPRLDLRRPVRTSVRVRSGRRKNESYGFY